jgi:hypothetical protein
MNFIRYGIDPDPKTVEVRMAALSAEGFNAANLGITEQQLRHHLDPCNEPALFELWKMDPVGRAPFGNGFRLTTRLPTDRHAQTGTRQSAMPPKRRTQKSTRITARSAFKQGARR